MSAVVFDLDNTLLLSEKCKHDTMREIVCRYDGGLAVLETVPSDSRTAPPGVTVTRHSIFAGVAHGLHTRGVYPGPAGESADALGVRLCDEFSHLLEQRLAVAQEVPGAAALLRHLAAAGIPCYVNTATPQEPAEKLIKALGWSPFFRAVLGAPRTKVQNLEAVAVAEQLAPSQLVHVGDGNNDCLAAQAFGCTFIGVVLDEGAEPFTGPVHTVVCDMHQACNVVNQLAGLPLQPL